MYKLSSRSKYKVLEVSLNGTDKNPWHKQGLKQSPFYQGVLKGMAEDRLNSLGGDPIPHVNYIRERLHGFSPGFIQLCVCKFVPGKYVTFKVKIMSRMIC